MSLHTSSLPSVVSRRARSLRGERGQSLVEFVLTAPLLMLLLLGLVEIGHGLNSYLTVVNTARDGARLGAEGAASDDAIRNLISVEAGRLDGTPASPCLAGASVSCTITREDISSEDSVQVEVCYDHKFILGVPGLIPGVLGSDTIKMCSRTAMRVVS